MPSASLPSSSELTPAWPTVSARLQRGLLLAGVVVFLISAFGVIEHDLVFANGEITKINEKTIRDKYIDQMETGNRLRQVAVVGFGALGAAGLVLSRRTPWNVRWRTITPLLLLLVVAMLSAAWSPQPVVSAKRLVILNCIVLGAAGLARLLSPREFLLCSLLSLLGFTLGSLAIDVAAGGRPWQGGDYRFGGTLHPNAQATYCAVLCLAAYTQPAGFGSRWLTRLLCGYSIGLIVVTQSRTGLVSLVIALVAVWMLRLPAFLKWAGVAFVGAAAAGGYVAWNSVGDGVHSRAVDAALLGRTEQSKSLTGRVPLWEELIDYAADRPLLGYGYEGFWTDDRIAAIMKSQKWTLQNAHNSYLEVVLQLGLVGLFLTAWFLLSGSATLVDAYNRTRDPGYAFAFGVVVLGMSNSLLESLFIKLRYTPTIAMIGLLAAALFFPKTDIRDTDDAPPLAPEHRLRPLGSPTPAILPR